MNGMYDARSSSKSAFESSRMMRLKREKQKQAKTREKLTEFLSADIQDSEFGIVPEGYGGITYVAFFIFGPWIMGILFIFFYVSGGSLKAFTSLDTNFFLTWIIGYEILGSIILLIILKKLISHLNS